MSQPRPNGGNKKRGQCESNNETNASGLLQQTSQNQELWKKRFDFKELPSQLASWGT